MRAALRPCASVGAGAGVDAASFGGLAATSKLRRPEGGGLQLGDCFELVFTSPMSCACNSCRLVAWVLVWRGQRRGGLVRQLSLQLLTSPRAQVCQLVQFQVAGTGVGSEARVRTSVTTKGALFRRSPICTLLSSGPFKQSATYQTPHHDTLSIDSVVAATTAGRGISTTAP